MNGKRKTNSNNITILVLMILVCVLMAFIIPDTYFTGRNLKSIAYQFPEYGILAFGMMLCMITGGIDLSMVGIMNLSGMVAALILKALIPVGTTSTGQITFVMILAIIAALATGALCGIFNGFVIGFFRQPAMIVTLCSLQIFSGIVYGVTAGSAITGMYPGFAQIANGTIGAASIPRVLLIFLLVFICTLFFVKCTVPGKHIYYLGSNQRAAVLSGINTLKLSILIYMISGILAGISGVLITSHLNAAKSSNGTSYTLLTLLIVVLGGVHPDGGSGNVIGVTLSILLMQMVSNAFTLMHISQNARNFANGLILVVVLVISAKKKAK